MAQIKLADLRTSTYAFLDPASGRKARRQGLKNTRSRSAIAVIAIDQLHRVFLLYTWADRVQSPAIMAKVFEVNKKFRPRIFGIEDAGQQALFIQALIAEAKRKGERINIASVQQPNDLIKDDRIKDTLQPLEHDGRLFYQAHQIEFEDEYRGFPTARSKDILDALASAINLAPRPRPKAQEQQELDDLAAYLRSQGYGASQIQEEIARIRSEESLLTH